MSDKEYEKLKKHEEELWFKNHYGVSREKMDDAYGDADYRFISLDVFSGTRHYPKLKD